MGEIDTKPIDSVQTALAFFGHSPTRDEQEVHKENEQQSLEKELASVKVQLEAKASAYKQALLKIEHHHRTAEELSTLLIKSDFQKEFYVSECQEANLRINELESALERVAHKISESEKVQKQLSDVTSDLESTKGQLISLEAELAALREKAVEVEREKADALESEAKAVAEAQGMENQLMMELKQANDIQVELKMELEKTKEKENDAKVDVAVLKFELHKEKSKLAEAEAAEARAQSEKAALYNALQLMGLEAEETKNENRVLKEAIKLADESKSCEFIEPEKEVGELEKKLEAAMARIGELRTRAEQAISRAEAAEKSKAELEDKMKRRKEQKERRKTALAALREASASRDYDTAYSKSYDTSTKYYQPLGKVLNMKF